MSHQRYYVPLVQGLHYVFLEHGASPSFGLRTWLSYLEKLASDTSDLAVQRKREYAYQVKGLGKLRDLAAYCPSVTIPIRDPQGPLVVVSVTQCNRRT